jgi:glycosyltransferase involved in cell wall biosynthesis
MSAAEVDVSILTTGHDVADARLHRLAAVLISEGFSVEVRGLGMPSAGPPGATVRTSDRRSLLRRAVRAVLLPWVARGRVLIVLDPDLIPPALVRRWTARRLGHRAAGQRVVADVHEDYASALLDRAWARGARLVGARLVVAGAVRAASQADVTLVADDHLPPHRPRVRLVLRNLPLLDMLPEPTPFEPAPRAIYIGDVRRSRGLQMMLAVLEACPEWSLDVVGPVAAADRCWLDHWRATSAASHRVAFHDRHPPREAWRVAGGAWAGVCLLEPTPAFVAALPSKVLEYLGCGLAVLTTPLPRAAALVVEAGAGAIVGDVEAAVAILRGWSREPDAVHKYQAAARAWAVENLSRPDQYREFGRLMARLARPEEAQMVTHQHAV